jgi:hypothetical protein
MSTKETPGEDGQVDPKRVRGGCVRREALNSHDAERDHHQHEARAFLAPQVRNDCGE